MGRISYLILIFILSMAGAANASDIALRNSMAQATDAIVHRYVSQAELVYAPTLEKDIELGPDKMTLVDAVKLEASAKNGVLSCRTLLHAPLRNISIKCKSANGRYRLEVTAWLGNQFENFAVYGKDVRVTVDPNTINEKVTTGSVPRTDFFASRTPDGEFSHYQVHVQK